MWHSKKIDDIYKEVDSNELGLDSKKADIKLKENGYNKLPESKEKTIFSIFFEQFINPIIYILGAAALFSLIIGEYTDTIFIIVVVLLDAFLGTYQEWQAEKSSESLKEIVKVKANVLRDNKEIVIDSEYLVVGDIVFLESGFKIPADIRLIDTVNLSIDESLLTGESIATVKNTDIINENTGLSDRHNMCYAGSKVLTGRGKGIVVAVGVDTEIGKIADNVINTVDTKTPLVIRMEKFTKQLSLIALSFSVLLIFILIFKGYNVSETFLLVVALAVSAIPEGLPVVLTVTLSIAANRMAKRNVIVKKLNSVEGLGSATVIASDKTGTLTINEQTAKVIVLKDGSRYEVTGQGYNGQGEILPYNTKSKYKDSNSLLEQLVLSCMINNEANLYSENNKWIYNGDAIDVAFLALSKKMDINKDYVKVGSIPYESENRYSTAFYSIDNANYVTMKGSIEKVLEFVDDINKEELIKINNELSSEGYRVIAVASIENEFIKKDIYDEKDIPRMNFLGLVGFIDPIREEVKQSIKNCTDSGIRVIMITGDHPLTAYKIASDLNLTNNKDEICTGEDIAKYLSYGEKELDEFIKNKKVFSRVDPIQKLDIVNSLKRQGEFVAVTGDGVNDAPALKGANIGIAMGSGTDVTKDTGSIIITDDNFLSIAAGVEEGRYAYGNIRKVTYLLISCCLAEVLFFLLSILFNYPVPFLAVQLLWLNLVTEGIQDTALAFEKGEKVAMRPRKTSENIFDRLLIEETLISGLVIGGIIFIAWIVMLDILKFDVTMARSHAILLMVFLQNIHVFNCRSEVESAFKIPFKNNWFIIISIFLTTGLQILISETNLLDSILKVHSVPFLNMIILFICATPLLLIMELYKKYRRKKYE